MFKQSEKVKDMECFVRLFGSISVNSLCQEWLTAKKRNKERATCVVLPQPMRAEIAGLQQTVIISITEQNQCSK